MTKKINHAVIKLTDGCQNICGYCANEDGPEGLRNASAKLAGVDTDISRTMPAFTITDILSTFRPDKVEFTGGEPTSELELLILGLSEAKKYGAKVIMMNSNMELLTPNKIDTLVDAGLTRIHFALHTLDYNEHKLIRGNKNASLKKVLENVNYILKNTQLEVIVEYVPMIYDVPQQKNNLQALKGVYDYVLNLRKVYGERILSLEIGKLMPAGRAKKENIPSLKSQIKTILESINNPKMPVEIYCYGSNITQELGQKGFIVNTCHAGRSMFYFNQDGEVYADNFSGLKIANHYNDFDGTPIVSSTVPLEVGLNSCPFAK